ncbi:MAG: glycosyltransferase [Clostridia bacterium]|nr:glycosyltransferase [Clostridia bacterium]
MCDKKPVRIAHINMSVNGSTGTIMLQIAQKARETGYTVSTYSTHVFSKRYIKNPPKPVGHSYYGSYLENAVHYAFGSRLAKNGRFGFFSTLRLINKIKKEKIEILHLHNLHNYCINLPLLFSFIKKHDIKVVWTLHDCWSFTGHCAHFDYAGCDKWKTGCFDCQYFNEYPFSKKDGSKKEYALKKDCFTGVKNLTIVTPSEWLLGLVKQSFLGSYPVKVINNGIDLSTFKPMESDFRKIYGLEDKFVLLGVAFDWGLKKGLDVFKKLAEKLNGDYQIVLVGVTETVKSQLPENIIAINKTQNQEELAKIYSSSDLFVNPTREDTFPTVNIEALACGTPVLTFNTGGSPEILDEKCGAVVNRDDFDALIKEIERIKQAKPFSKEDCLNRAKNFNKEDKFIEYVKLYGEI